MDPLLLARNRILRHGPAERIPAILPIREEFLELESSGLACESRKILRSLLKDLVSPLRIPGKPIT
jgi:hypothetical protein